MTLITLKILHFIGLMMGGGAGFGSMIVMGAIRRADDAGKAALMPLRPKLANIGLAGVVLLWLTGVGMALTGEVAMALGLWFWLKMLVAGALLAIAVYGLIVRRKMAAGQAVPAIAAKLPMMSSPMAILAVIFAVMAFS
jgi:hypothetical protein